MGRRTIGIEVLSVAIPIFCPSGEIKNSRNRFAAALCWLVFIRNAVVPSAMEMAPPGPAGGGTTV